MELILWLKSIPVEMFNVYYHTGFPNDTALRDEMEGMVFKPYYFLTAMLPRYAGFSLLVVSGGYSSGAACGLLIAVALVAEHER